MKRETKKYIGICLYGGVCVAAGLLWEGELVWLLLLHGGLALVYGGCQLATIAVAGRPVDTSQPGPEKKPRRGLWTGNPLVRSVGSWGHF